MALTASVSISNDITFTLTKQGTNTQSEVGKLNYSRSLTNGTGSLQGNFGLISSGSLSSGTKQYFNLTGLTKESFGNNQTVGFDRIKGILIENNHTGYGQDLNVYATGATAFTAPWRGSSGNVPVKPYAVWQYADPISGAVVDASNKQLTLENIGTTGINWTLIVVGTSG